MMSKRCIFGCFLLGLVASERIVVAADEVRSNPAVERNIKLLVSPNPEPTWPRGDDGTERPTYARGFDHDRQYRVMRARDELIREGFKAFPKLVDHLDDRRYCLTRGGGASWVNLSVGDVCREIIALQVQVYQPLIDSLRHNKLRLIWVPRSKDWWLVHKDVTLREIQLEGVKEAIKYEGEREIGTKDERVAVLDGLNRLARRLEEKKEPIKVDLDGEYVDEPELDPANWKASSRKSKSKAK